MAFFDARLRGVTALQTRISLVMMLDVIQSLTMRYQNVKYLISLRLL